MTKSTEEFKVIKAVILGVFIDVVDFYSFSTAALATYFLNSPFFKSSFYPKTPSIVLDMIFPVFQINSPRVLFVPFSFILPLFHSPALGGARPLVAVGRPKRPITCHTQS